MRFLLGNLQGFDPRVQAVDPADMHYIDQYMLHLLHKYSTKVSFSPSPSPPWCSAGLTHCWYHVVTVEHNCCVCVCLQVTDAYSEFDAGRVVRVLQAFITSDLSSFYFSIIKDR